MDFKSEWNSPGGGAPRLYEGATLETIAKWAPLFVKDDFTGLAVDATNDWVKSIVNSSTFAPVSGEHGGIGRITTGAADTDDMDVSTPLCLKASKGIGMEARIATGDVAHTEFNLGFSDAVTEAADNIAFMFDTATLTTNATDAALFFSSSAATSNVLRAASVKADTDSTITTGSLLVDGAFHIYRVEINSSGDIDFYLDGVLFKHLAASITTTVALCVYAALINHEGSANTLDVDYIAYWALSR